MPEPDKVWHADLDFAPRNVWMVRPDGKVVRIPLARTPNWQPPIPTTSRASGSSSTIPTIATWGTKDKLGGVDYPMGYDTVNLTHDADYYKDAVIRCEYGWVMGTPYPSHVLKFDPVKHSLTFGGQWGGGAGAYHYPRHVRYYLEDKPQYLDDGNSGEFWFDKQGDGGRLYLRLPGDADPNSGHVEVAKRCNLIDSEGMSHVHISGLAMRFTNVWFDLTALPGKDVDVACVRLLGPGRDLVVANCTFEHVHLPVRFRAVGDRRRHRRRGHPRQSDPGHRPRRHLPGRRRRWAEEGETGRLLDVKVLRNRVHECGFRTTRDGQGHAIEVGCAVTTEVAGNVLDRTCGSGIQVWAASSSRRATIAP